MRSTGGVLKLTLTRCRAPAKLAILCRAKFPQGKCFDSGACETEEKGRHADALHIPTGLAGDKALLDEPA